MDPSRVSRYGADMTAKTPTLADLRKAGTITSQEIVAAVDAYLRDPAAGPYRFSSGHSLDIAAAMAASPDAPEMLGRLGPREKVIRSTVTTVIMALHVSSP